MIISEFLSEVFKNETLVYNEFNPDFSIKKSVTKPIKFHFGDQLELNKWLVNRTSKDNYPLVWYVISSYKKDSSDFINAFARINLFTLTKQEYYNNERQLVNYKEILSPLFLLVYEKLVTSNFCNAFDFDILDVPNYGVKFDLQNSNQNSDFNSVDKKGTMAIAPDILDAKIINFNIKLNYNKFLNCKQ